MRGGDDKTHFLHQENYPPVGGGCVPLQEPSLGLASLPPSLVQIVTARFSAWGWEAFWSKSKTSAKATPKKLEKPPSP